MTRTVFREFDEFADAINGVAGRFVPTGRSQSDWWVQAVPVGRLLIQQVQIGGASIFAGDGRDQAITLGIPVTAPERIRIDGDSLGRQSFIAVREGQPFTFAARQRTLWAGVTIPMEGMLSPQVIEAVCSGASTVAASVTHTVAAPAYVAALRSIVIRVCANDGKEMFAGPVRRALEEEVTMLASRMLLVNKNAGCAVTGRPRYNRSRVIARVLGLLDASRGGPLFLQDLCAAAQVCERTLRTIFHDYFGVGPMRLIKLRQLHEIHGALLTAEDRRQNVSEVLAHFGVSDLSVFARNYKALYGEVPSRTLRRAPLSERRRSDLSLTWLQYASRRFEVGWKNPARQPEGTSTGLNAPSFSPRS